MSYCSSAVGRYVTEPILLFRHILCALSFIVRVTTILAQGVNCHDWATVRNICFGQCVLEWGPVESTWRVHLGPHGEVNQINPVQILCEVMFV